MGGDPTDAEVIAASRYDPDRFGEIFDRHYPAVFRYVARRVGHNDANDIASDVFLIAFRDRHRFDPAVSRSAKAWLFGIATNLIRRRARTLHRRFRAASRAAGEGHVSLGDDIEDRLDAQREFASVGDAINQLSRIDRETLLLYALTDLTYQEVASIRAC